MGQNASSCFDQRRQARFEAPPPNAYWTRIYKCHHKATTSYRTCPVRSMGTCGGGAGRLEETVLVPVICGTDGWRGHNKAATSDRTRRSRDEPASETEL